MKKLLFCILMTVFLVLPALGALKPNSCYDQNGRFTFVYAGTSTERDAVPSGVWTIEEGDLWWDTDNDILYSYDGTDTWIPQNASGGATYLYLTPDDTADANSEGTIYYDSDTDNLYYMNAVGWQTIASSTSSTLDEAYSAGQGVTIDSGALTLTTDANSDSAALAIVHGETGNYAGMTLTNASAYPGIQITTSGAGADITGTSATWSISKVGALACVGITNTAGDVLFDDTYDVQWDTSEDTMRWLDNAVIGIGGALSGASDLTIKGDGTNILVEVATQDAADLIFGATNALDIIVYNDAADSTVTFDNSGELLTLNGWDIQLQDDDVLAFGDGKDVILSQSSANLLTIGQTVAGTGSVAVGVDDAGLDWTFFGDTASAYAMWDTSANQILVAGGGQISLNDDVELLVGTGTTNAGDFKIYGTSAPALVIDVVSAGSGEIQIGNDADDVPLRWYGETASSYFLFTGDQLQGDAVTIALGDGDAILLGDTLGTGDFSISDESDVLTINNVADGTGSVAFGAAAAGIDVAFHGDAGSGQMLWDENANTNGALVFDNADIEMGDGDFIQLGDGADLTASATGTTTTITMAAGSDLDILDTDNAASKILFGTVGGTHGLDITFNGVTAGNIVAFDAGAETLTLTDVDLVCTAPDATDVAATFNAGGANTASVVQIDGATGAAAWVGADNVGMLHITGDGVGAHAGATLLYVANSAQPIAAAEGFLARFVDTGTARPGAYAVEIEVTDTTGGLKVDGYSTFTKGVQASSQGLTATADGLDTGITPVGASFCTVTSDNADKVVTLPTTVVGNIIYYYCAANGFELETPAASNATINGVDCDGTNQLACAATSLYKAVCVADSVWIVTGEGADGADTGTLTPDAD
jgi:hypothetical protein